jgi:23S rRNA pseudouridine1911/1915/1917 synthase
MIQSSQKHIHLKINLNEPSQRLDRYLAKHFSDLSRSFLKKVIESNLVRLNGEVVSANTKVKPGDEIDLVIPAKEASELQPQKIALSIVHEDDDILIINKAAGMVIHPAAGHAEGTLVNALLHHDPNIARVGGEDRPGIVHRLDKGTSGILVVAKTENARLSLVEQFKDRRIYKEYWALAHGVVSPIQGTFRSSLGRDPRHRKKIASTTSGRPAETDYKVLHNYAGLFCDVQLVLHTGRTHQIRVHLSEAGHPIVGDKTYGGNRDVRKTLPENVRSAIRALNRPALHAAVLGFQHPRAGEDVRFEAPLPGDLNELMERLKCL